jgi:hypothetical protein
MSLLQEIEQFGLADCEFNRKQLSDEITISWHFSDIQEVDDTLTNDEAREILHLMKEKHDANIGINWEVIDSWIDFYRANWGK